MPVWRIVIIGLNSSSTKGAKHIGVFGRGVWGGTFLQKSSSPDFHSLNLYFQAFVGGQGGGESLLRLFFNLAHDFVFIAVMEQD